MEGLTVTFFGHKDAPKEIESALRLTLMDLIENKNANVFYVGNHGTDFNNRNCLTAQLHFRFFNLSKESM